MDHDDICNQIDRMFIDQAIKDVKLEQEIINQVIPKHVQVQKRRGIGVRPRTLIAVTAILLSGCVLLGSSALLDYFSRIEANIDVTPTLLIDGACGTIIQESFSAQAGTSVNRTHSIQNLGNQTIIVNFSVVSCDEGLDLKFFKAYEPFNEILYSLSIESQTTYNINISYTIAVNADPNQDLSAIIEVIYLTEPGGP